MIEYTVMDYEGEPTIIENGEMYDAEPPTRILDDYGTYHDEDEGEIYWDSEKRDWDIDLYDFNGNDRKDYGLGWYDCN